MARSTLRRTTFGDQDLIYSYSTLPVERLPELQQSVDALDQAGRLATHTWFREQVADARYALPRDLPEARSIIILALSTRLQHARFHWKGRTHDAYFDKGYLTVPTADALRETVRSEIVRSAEHTAVELPHAHLKLLAARSGLGRYGRNNLCYVEGMGSFHRLRAFVTELELAGDEWTDLLLMDSCATCGACIHSCPTGAIREEDFVIDADRCITLHNEFPGELPGWIPAGAHHALLGCMQCQFTCPVNRAVDSPIEPPPDITEAETVAILSTNPDERLVRSVEEKLRLDLLDGETLAIVARNLRAAFGQEPV